MPTIVMTRELGTFTKHLAQSLAQRLGVKLIYRDLAPEAEDDRSNRVAPRGSAPRTDIEHFVESAGQQSLATAAELCDLAMGGNVLICGNGVAPLLAGIRHIVKVRVRTTMALRVKRIMACMESDDPEPALRRVLSSDRRIETGLARLFGNADREQPSLYDLVVDSGGDSVEQCVEKILAFAGQTQFESTPDSAAQLKNRILRIAAARNRQAIEDSYVHVPAAKQPMLASSWTSAWPNLGWGMTANENARVGWSLS
jgi:cytidylate kinase